MKLEVIPASPDDRPLLRQLVELYLYDFSEFDQRDVDDEGLYGYRWFDAYWSEPGRHPFLFRVDGHPAGFALVRAGASTEMAEFFILRKYRGNGAGSEAAGKIFASFPGRWLISQVPGNEPATRFWRAAIPVPFSEQRSDEGHVRQEFTIPAGFITRYRDPSSDPTPTGGLVAAPVSGKCQPIHRVARWINTRKKVGRGADKVSVGWFSARIYLLFRVYRDFRLFFVLGSLAILPPRGRG